MQVDGRATVNVAAWRALRQARGVSLRELSSRVAADAGLDVSYAHLANIELGRRGTTLRLVEAVALALDVPAAALMHEPNARPAAAGPGVGAAREDKSTSSAPNSRGQEAGEQGERSHVGAV